MPRSGGGNLPIGRVTARRSVTTRSGPSAIDPLRTLAWRRYKGAMKKLVKQKPVEKPE